MSSTAIDPARNRPKFSGALQHHQRRTRRAHADRVRSVEPRIGEEPHLAESSVKTHVGHLLAKLRLHDRVQPVIFAYQTGLMWRAALHALPE
jgi:hypothetical protein